MLDSRDLLKIEDLAWVLLMRLLEHTGDVYSSVYPRDLSTGHLSWWRREEIDSAIQFLKDRDLLEVFRRHPSSPETIKLTSTGKREAQRLKFERQAPEAWFDHTVERLARAAFLRELGSTGLMDFSESPLFRSSDFNGSANGSWNIAKRAAFYLRDHGLVELTESEYSIQTRDVGYRWWNKRMRTTEGTTVKKLKLSARGIDCILSGKTVREYLNAQSSAGAGPVFNQHVYGGAAAQGVNVTQNVGVQAEQLAHLIQQLRTMAPQLPHVDQEEFLHDIDVLEDTDQEQQDRLSAGQRIKAAIASGSSQIGGQAIVTALERLTGLITNQ